MDLCSFVFMKPIRVIMLGLLAFAMVGVCSAQRTPEQEAIIAEYAKNLYEGHANRTQTQPTQVAPLTAIHPREARAARRGDPIAGAKVRLQATEYRINSMLRNGQISEEAAQFQWRLAHENYHREISAIEQQRLLNEMRFQAMELQRIRQEMESRHR
jgi:hypothetical protein